MRMEEKILFKEKTRKLITAIQIVIILLGIFMMAVCVADTVESQIRYSHRHDFGCVYDKDGNLFTEGDYQSKSSKYSSVHAYIEGEYKKHGYDDGIVEDCGLIWCDNLEQAQKEELEDCLLFYIPMSIVIIAVMIAVSLLLKLAKQKYFVTEQRIYGKKGYKKFDVSFDDILSIKKENKEITIKTEDKILKLFAYKNSAAIYDHIKPYAREEETSQQIVVDDIKLF